MSSPCEGFDRRSPYFALPFFAARDRFAKVARDTLRARCDGRTRLCEERSDVAIRSLLFRLKKADRRATLAMTGVKGRSPRYARDYGTGRATFPKPLAITEVEKIVILNEVKNLVLFHLTNITSLIRSFGALRMTKLRQITAQTQSAQSKRARGDGISSQNRTNVLYFSRLNSYFWSAP